MISPPVSFFLRLLLPTWRFFDGAGDKTELYYRYHSNSGESCPWALVVRPQKTRNLSNFLLNANGNLRLALLSLVDQLLEEIQQDVNTSGLEVSDWVSYRLVKNWVQLTIEKSTNILEMKNFEFKVVVGGEDVLFSKKHELR